MAYVDHAFSISDDPTETYIVNNKPPIKEIAFAIVLLSLGARFHVWYRHGCEQGWRRSGAWNRFLNSWSSSVFAWLLLYQDCILCLQRLQRVFFLQYPSRL
ncbi:unnamed protein product, partial [Sphagnum troendelagicum]